jgi:hypothetical protein
MGSHSSRIWNVHVGNWEERGPRNGGREGDQNEDKEKV